MARKKLAPDSTVWFDSLDLISKFEDDLTHLTGKNVVITRCDDSSLLIVEDGESISDGYLEMEGRCGDGETSEMWIAVFLDSYVRDHPQKTRVTIQLRPQFSPSAVSVHELGEFEETLIID